ncbi:aldolase [Candidatus Poribacteria bacterium]|nr:aldolase [Candidatus Poribacteria bacterium]
MENHMKSKLKAGKTVIGSFLKITDPAVIEIMGRAGFDFGIIDMEHGPIGYETAQNLIRAAEVAGICPIIRVSENDPVCILRALDIGAQGVEVPQIRSAKDAKKTAESARYFPEGKRGVCRYVRAARYSSMERQEYFRKANESVLTIVHLEGIEAIENLDSIMSVDGVDILFIGPYDLSQSVGVPGQVSHPSVIEQMEKVITRAKDADKIVGTFADDISAAKRWLDVGVMYVAISVDVGILYDACRNMVTGLGLE